MVASLAVLLAVVPAADADTSLNAPTVASWIHGIKMVDYFPSGEAWDNMWTNFDPSAISSDFARIAAMHANTVRIIPRISAFGYPQPSAVMLDRLQQTVDLAQSHGLRVELTMFDGFRNYSDVSGSEQWATAILSRYAGNPEIAYVDLRNEINREPSSALNWAEQLLPEVRTTLSGVPVTASVTINEGVQNLQTVLDGLGSVRPDLYDVHFYGQDGQAYSRLRAVQQLVAPASVILGETGYSTTAGNASVPGLAQTTVSQEAYQDYYLRSVDYAAQTLGIPAAPWILSDFTATAWPGANRQAFGLYRTDGTAKAAVQSETDYFGQGAISTDFNGGFEQTTLVHGQREPLLWRQYQPVGVSGNLSADPTVARTGTNSGRISSTSGGVYGCASFYLVPISALDPLQTYTGQAYAKGDQTTGSNYVSLSWFDANGVYLSESDTRSLPTGAAGWTLLSVSAKPPTGAAFVQFHVKSCRNSGTVWFDDAQFTPVPPALAAALTSPSSVSLSGAPATDLGATAVAISPSPASPALPGAAQAGVGSSPSPSNVQAVVNASPHPTLSGPPVPSATAPGRAPPTGGSRPGVPTVKATRTKAVAARSRRRRAAGKQRRSSSAAK